MQSNKKLKFTDKQFLKSKKNISVYKAKDRNENMILIKEFYIDKIDKKFLYTIINIKSENFVDIINSYEENDKIIILNELCNYNLEDYLKVKGNSLSIKEIKEIILQINKCLLLMLKINVFHGNLTLSNIFICINKSNKFLVKISLLDSINFYKNSELQFITERNPSLFQSPEILNDNIYSNKTDLWSLGIIIYYLIFKEFPFKGNSNFLLFNNIKSNINKMKETKNNELNKLLKKMLIIDPNKRISFNDYFNDVFFQQQNYIICECNINSKDINKLIQILNYSKENEKEIKENYQLYLDKKQIDFSFEFKKEGNYMIEIICKKEAMNNNKIFSDCSSLTSLDFSNYNTNKVINMSEMFFNCSSLTSLDLSNFNTSNVTNMNAMFYNCSSLKNLNVSSFNTSKVKEMIEMFSECSSLKSLDLSNFNTSNVINTSFMFCNCSSLTDLKINNFDTQNVINLSKMFSGCSSLTSLNLNKFDTKNTTNMWEMFSLCSSLTSLNLINFNTSNVTNMVRMFSECSSLTTLDLSNFNTLNVNDMNYMFFNCTSLKDLIISNKFKTDNVSNMHHMFYYCSSLKTLNLSNFNTQKVKEMSGMFSCCASLTSIDLSKFNTENVQDMSYMFFKCTSLTSLNLSNFTTSKVNDMSKMFSKCTSLTSLDLSKFNTSKVKEMSKMFFDCTKLKVKTNDKKILALLKEIK